MTFLDGIRVLDVSRVLAGPLAAQILGDMGAEVLKVEPPGGDETRGWGPPFQGTMSSYFQSCNRNKAALTLDLKQSEERRRLLELAGAADIWLDNYPDDVRARLGLDLEHLRQANPDLIVGTISSYPRDTPQGRERGYDLILQAQTGTMGIIGPVDGPAYKVGHAVIDVLAGMMLANAVLGALVRRLRRGDAAAVEVSLFGTGLFSLVNVATGHLQTGRPTARYGNAHPNIVPYQAFRTGDRDIVIGAGNDRQFQALCQCLDLPDEVHRWNNAERVEQRERLVQTIQEALAGRASDEVVETLRRVRVPASLILRPDEALEQCRRNDPAGLVAIEHAKLGRIETVANPIRAEGMRQDHTAPPLPGEGGEELARRWLAAR